MSLFLTISSHALSHTPSGTCRGIRHSPYLNTLRGYIVPAQVSLVPLSKLERGTAVEGFHLDSDRKTTKSYVTARAPWGGQGSAASGSREPFLVEFYACVLKKERPGRKPAEL